MRYLLAVLVLMSSCFAPPIPTEPTGVIVAARNGGGFAACEVVLGESWTDFQAWCGKPLTSMDWYGRSGRCHFYETNAVSLANGSGTPYVAICVRPLARPGRSGDLERKVEMTGDERIAFVVGLRQIPGRPDLGPLPY